MEPFPSLQEPIQHPSPCFSFSYLLVDSGNNSSSPTVIAELAKINTLPCAKIQFSVGDRNGDAYAKQRTFGMRRHIVSTFQHMVVVWLVLPDDVIHNLLHIASYIRIGILVHAESA